MHPVIDVRRAQPDDYGRVLAVLDGVVEQADPTPAPTALLRALLRLHGAVGFETALRNTGASEGRVLIRQEL